MNIKCILSTYYIRGEKIMKNKNEKESKDSNKTKYGEIIPSFFAWIPLGKQKERVEKLEKIEKNNKNKRKS